MLLFQIRRLLPVPSDFIEFVQRAPFPSGDVFGGFGPREGPRLFIVLPKAVADGGLRVADAGVAASPDALRRDLVERFFVEITSRRIRRGSYSSVDDLEAAIYDYLAQHNAKPKPFRSQVRQSNA